MLQDIVDQIEKGGAKTAKAGGELKIGSSVLPTLPRDPGDRNRTSPFAFTGNKFEFRAVGSSQSVAGPIVVLNTIVAESLDDFATQLEQAVAAGKNLDSEIQHLLQNAIKQSKDVIFNGDNYTEKWHADAERRGLPNKRNAVESFPDIISQKSVNLFTKYAVFNERELHSRYEIYVEGYKKTINIESQLTLQMATRMILPAALRYQEEVARSIASLKATGATVPKAQSAHLNEVVQAIDQLQSSTDAAERRDRRSPGRRLARPRQARARRDHPRHERRPHGRRSARALVADDLWPLPTYQEMLFLK